jgi:sporulation protein YlmC with PRC-barrel domain
MREVNELLWQSVELNGIPVGRVVDVILEGEHGRVVGFEVRCEDGRHRFLPRAAASDDGSVIRIESPLALLDSDQLDFYRRRGVTLRSREEPAA